MIDMPCREWIGARTAAGYGARRVAGRVTTVHRWVVEQVGEDQFGTPWDPDLHVMHLCDNRVCFLYWHLRLGTNADNIADSVAKGRRQRNDGEPRLTPEQRAEIAARYREGDISLRKLASLYGVNVMLVRKCISDAAL